MQFIWTDPGVQAALIQSFGGILSATIAAIAAALIGKRFIDQKRLQDKNALMQRDIFFLLAVEEAHCVAHGQKLTVRDAVREKGYEWSGKFTPGRVTRRQTD